MKVSYPELPEFSLKTMIIFNKNVTNTTTSKNQSNIDKLGRVMKKVLRISLYQSLFPDDLKDGLLRLSHGELTSSALVDVLADRLPGEVSENTKCMQWLSMCTRRINQMQLPRYVKLYELLSALMKIFISKENAMSFASVNVSAYDCAQNEQNEDGASDINAKTKIKTTDDTIEHNCIGDKLNAGMLELRYKYFQDHIDNLPWNIRKRESLVSEYGYAASFWRDQHQLEVSYSFLLMRLSFSTNTMSTQNTIGNSIKRRLNTVKHYYEF